MFISKIKRILESVKKFDWGKGNINKNLLKHRVTDKETEEIFANNPKFIIEDEKHSIKEKRYMLWGITNKERKLTVIFTIRKNKIRIISSRDMNRKERSFYEKES